MTNTIRQKQRVFLAFYNKHKMLTIAVVLAIISLTIYANTQAFLNLWFTRDQQAMFAIKQGDTAKAAITFTDKNWVAYSFYADGDFEQAITLYKGIEGTDALFSQANALAHSGQYVKAAEFYQQILNSEPQYQGATTNLKIMNELIKKMKKGAPKKTNTEEIAGKPKLSDDKDKPKAKKVLLSSDLWLKQIQQNPSKFLRKKFQQEYINANQ